MKEQKRWMFTYLGPVGIELEMGPYRKDDCRKIRDRMKSFGATCSEPAEVPDGHRFQRRPLLRFYGPEEMDSNEQRAAESAQRGYEDTLNYIRAEFDVIQNVMDFELSYEFLKEMPGRIMKVVKKGAGSGDYNDFDDETRNRLLLSRSMYLELVSKAIDNEAGSYTFYDGSFWEDYSSTLKKLASEIRELG